MLRLSSDNLSARVTPKVKTTDRQTEGGSSGLHKGFLDGGEIPNDIFEIDLFAAADLNDDH